MSRKPIRGQRAEAAALHLGVAAWVVLDVVEYVEAGRVTPRLGRQLDQLSFVFERPKVPAHRDDRPMLRVLVGGKSA